MSLSQTGDVEPVRASSWSAWLPVAILLVGALLTAGAWRTLHAGSDRQLLREIEAQTAAVDHEIRARLEDRMSALGRMAARWQHEGRPAESDWEHEARAHHDDHGGYQALEWVDPTGHVRWVVPVAGNEAALGLDLARDPVRRSTMEEARAARDVRATVPVQLAQGGTGVLVFFPLFVAERFDGYLLAVVNHEALLRAILRADIAPELGIEVASGGRTVFARGPAFLPDDARWSRTSVVGLTALPWQVRVWLPAAARATRQSRYPEGIAFGGAWLTILLAVSVSAAQRASQRKRALERVHQRVLDTIAQRAHAEASLAASELRFQQVVEHMGAVFWQWSPGTGALEYVSPGYEAIWGRPRAELYGDPDSWLAHVLPEDRHLARIDTATASLGGFQDRCYRIVRPDGTLRWIRDRSFLSRDGAGAIAGIAGLAEDITAARESDALLAGEKAIFAMVASHAPLGDTLAACCRLVESLSPGSRTAILVRAPHASVLTCGAAPSLPADYVEALARLQVSATSLGGGATWSYPMVDESGAILGTLAVHRAATEEPSPHDVGVFERVRDLAAIVIERRRAEEALRLTQFAVDHVADQIFLIDPDGRFLDVNPAACRRLGYTRAELLGMSVADIDPDRPADAWPGHWAEVERRRHWRLETRHRAKSGEIYPVDITANYVDHEGRRYSYAVVRDVTEWKRSLRALEESEERLRLATEAGHMGTWEWDAAAAMLWYSPNLARLFGLSSAADDLGPMRFRNAIHPDDRPRLETAIAATVAGDAVGQIEFRIVWPDGSVHWVASHSRVHRDRDGHSARIVGIVVDVEQRKTAEREREALVAELAAANGMLTQLSRQLLDVQETERRDLARDLHDEIGQCIAAAKINLGLLGRRFPSLDVQAPMEDTVALLDHILQHVSRLCAQLRPSVLDDLGLAVALRWYVERQSQRTGWQGSFDTDELPALSDRMQGVCFRTVQEALTNVMRHAQARTVAVELRARGDLLVLRVEDDGVGFDTHARPTRSWDGGGFGLLGMRERLRSVGGELSIESAPGRGTVVEARIPLGAEEDVPPLAAAATHAL